LGVGGKEKVKKKKQKAWGEHQRIYIRRSIRRKLQKKWWRVETRASEAKGPFPGGKRVGSWGKKKKVKVKVKAHGLRSMGRLFLHDVSLKKTPSTSKRWMGECCSKVTLSC